MQWANQETLSGMLCRVSAGLWKTLWKMESLTNAKVYVSAKHLLFSLARPKFTSIKSMTWKFRLQAYNMLIGLGSSVHNWAFPVKNSIAAQQNLDATLEECA
jgi:hypothetical protein